MQKVLLISYENDGKTIYRVSEALRYKGYEVLIVDGSISTATKFNQLPVSSYRGLEEPINKFKEKLKNKKLTINPSIELRYIEKKWISCRKNLRQLIRTSPYYYEDHHSRRPYYNIGSDHLRLCYVLELIKWFVDIIRDFKPDLVFCFQGNYFIKQLAASISLKFNYKYICLSSSRIRDFMMVLDHRFLPSNSYSNFAPSNDDYIRTNQILTDASLDLASFTYSGFFKLALKNIKNKNFKIQAFIHLLSLPFRLNWEFLHILRLNSTKFLKQRKKISFYLFNFSLKLSLMYTAITTVRKCLIFWNYKKYFCNLSDIQCLKNRKIRIVYLALHVLPESSTLCLSNNYYEDDLIRYISSRLPVDCILVIKENIQMLGERPLSFYEKINKLGNAYLIDPMVLSKQLLAISNAVVGISGTVLLEAKVFGIELVSAVGTPEFREVLPPEFQDYEGLNYMLNCLNTGLKPSVSNLKLIDYVAQVTALNIRWDHEMNSHVNHGYPLDEHRVAKIIDDVTKIIISFLIP